MHKPILFLMLAVPALADEIVTVKDGREVRLRDNGTWEYLGSTAPPKPTIDRSEGLETRTQIQKGISDMQVSFVLRHLALETARIRYSMGEDPNRVQSKVIYEKRDADLTRGKQVYDELMFRLRSAPKAQEALTEFYLYWKASMDQITPTSSESSRAYQARMKERERGQAERKDRLTLATEFLPKPEK